ncbi:hypothetical protein AC579_4540 [Pseudocercospora musae]|uniref:Cell wall mannoprotein PIR1-like C-terminal domain-containing protein n=1 Tax=Pseudocercospora musae TaxID=113226 RepID=A0A139IU73_9PEZI|nr:hypothetical protein AC579_4540 [Pseudocercospora musae]
MIGHAFALLIGAAFASSSHLSSRQSDCVTSATGQFEITVTTPQSPAQRLMRRQSDSCGQTGILTITLQNGELTDSDGRKGFVNSTNSQIVFDNPAQPGVAHVDDWSLCEDYTTIALSGSTILYECQTNGFSNLYSTKVQADCTPINIQIIPSANFYHKLEHKQYNKRFKHGNFELHNFEHYPNEQLFYCQPNIYANIKHKMLNIQDINYESEAVHIS